MSSADFALEPYLARIDVAAPDTADLVALSDTPQDQYGWAYRVVREDRDHVLQLRDAEGWRDLYAFIPEPRYPIDFEVANWYTSTHPESRFVRVLTVQLSTPEARHVLHNLTYTKRSSPERDTTREIARGELVPLLAEIFAIDVPAGARLVLTRPHARSLRDPLRYPG